MPNESSRSGSAGRLEGCPNILAGILGAAEPLREELGDEEHRELATDIAHEAQRGSALTRSLLAFARRGAYQRAPIAVDELVDEVCRVIPRTIPRTISLHRSGRADEVLVVSGYAAESSARDLIKEGLVGAFVEKPFTSATLRKQVERLIAPPPS